MKRLCTHTFSKGHLSYGQAVPRSFTTKPLSIDRLESQCDIKSTWPDGSVSHAVLSAIVPADDAYDILAEDDEPLPPDEPEPQMEVVITRDGKPYSIVLSPVFFRPTGHGYGDWLSGPLVEEYRLNTIPQNAAGEMPAKGFVVLLDIRMFKDGAKRISVAVENVEDRADAELLVTYDVLIKYKGEQVYPKEGVKTAPHYWGQRWREVFGVDGYVESQITFDLEPYFEAGAVPRIDKSIPDIRFPVITTAFDILKRGAMPEDGMAHGGRSDMAIVPQWIANWIVYQNPWEYKVMMEAADCSGSLPIHMRERDSMSLPNLDERPTLWGFSGMEKNRPDATRVPFSETTARWGIPASAGPTYPRKIDNAHMPSLCAVPYILTGDRYYADEVAFVANYHLLAWPGGNDVLRKTEVLTGDGEVRGKAYSLRNLADAAAWLPESDPMKEYFQRKILETLDAWDTLQATKPTPLGNVFDETDQVDRSRVVSKQWQLGALLWALDHTDELGLGAIYDLFDRVAKFLVDSATNPDWLKGDDRRSAIYQIFVAKKDPVTKVPNYFATWADAEAENAANGFFRNDFLAGPQSGDYPGSVLSGLVVAAKRGVPGAAEAVERVKPLTTSSNAGWRVEP